MATDDSSPEDLGPRKRKRSTKATTNGDPLEANRKKKLSAVNNDVTAALTKKRKTSADDESDVEIQDGSENGASEVISIEDDEEMEDDSKIEATEENTKTEIGRNFFFFVSNQK